MEAIHWPVKRFRLGENPFGRVTRPKESWLTVSVMVLWRKAQEEEVFEKTANLNRFVKSKRPMGHKSEAPNLCGLRRFSEEEITVNRSALVFLDKEHAPEATEEELLQETFSNLATDWKASTAAWSSIARRYAHPSYQAILALGKDAIPLILNELKNRPDYWFAALRVLTKDSPVGPEVGFDQAVEGWLAWGKAHGHLD